MFEDTTCRPPFTDQTWGEPLPPLNEALCAAHPNLAGWDHPYPDRSYVAAEVVLDPAGWHAAHDANTRQRGIGYRIIFGDRPLAPHARGGQGIPWRGTRTPFLRRAADIIDGLDRELARRAFSVPELAARGVYKVAVDDDEDALFDRVSGNLSALARYYRAVAALGLDLIVEQD